MKFKRILFMVVISLSLLFTLTNVAVADEKTGTKSQPTFQKSTQADSHSEYNSSHNSQTQPSGQANDHNIGMPGMDDAVTNNQHQTTTEMDSNMPEMKNTGAQAESHGAGGGHGKSSTVSEAVNWTILGGFLGINLLIIAIAGVLKLTQKNSSSNLSS